MSWGQLGCSDADDKVVRRILRGPHGKPVQAAEDDDRHPGKTIVAVDQSLISRQRLEQNCGLGVQVGVGVLTEQVGLRAVCCRVQQAQIPYGTDAQLFGQGQQVLQLEVAGHWAKRSSSGP